MRRLPIALRASVDRGPARKDPQSSRGQSAKLDP